MKTLAIFALAATLSGCAGVQVERTARHGTAVEATVEKNKEASALEQKKVETLGNIEIARIKAQNQIDMKELEIKLMGKTGTKSIDLDKGDDEDISLDIEFGDPVGARGAGHTISGNNNNVVIGSGRQGVNGGAKKESPIAEALISGMNKDPFSPIPQQPPPVDQYGPLLKFGESVVKTGAVLLGVDRLAGVWEAGVAQPVVRIDGDYVSRSNNPVITEFAAPAE